MSIPLAGVIGAPVGHSRSPILHGHWLRSLGIRKEDARFLLPNARTRRRCWRSPIWSPTAPR